MQNARCLILTYNTALVSDIKRMIALIGMPDGIDTYTLAISTLHKFFYVILSAFNFLTDNNGNAINYVDNYISLITKFYEYIQ
jgi:hypothetical protein